MWNDARPENCLELEGWVVTVSTFGVGGYLAEVEMVSSAVAIGRAIHAVRAIAKERAVESAIKQLGRNRDVDLDLTVGG
jgi:hypothetical protein